MLAFAERQLKLCQQHLALEKLLPLVLASKQSASPDQLLQLASLCQNSKKRHATAVHLYQKAFRAELALAEDWAKQHRYNAACAAALAGMGQGDETAIFDYEQKEDLRQQARAWLQADLDRHAKQLKEGKLQAILQSERRLSDWQADADLAGVRDPKELGKLPKQEGKLWQTLWADVGGLIREARSRFTDTRMEAKLTDKDKSKVHRWTMVAGRTYVIELQSTVFDAFLKLEDPQGKLLAENDDIDPGVNLNSRLIFAAPRDGSYRIVATSFEQAGRGAYVLTIRQFTGKK